MTVSEISAVRIALNVGTREYVGRHADPRDLSARGADPAAVVDALPLHRTSH